MALLLSCRSQVETTTRFHQKDGTSERRRALKESLLTCQGVVYFEETRAKSFWSANGRIG
jgi:hypothetical protein